MKPSVLAIAACMALAVPCAAAPEGYRKIESVAASVNGEVIFLSEVEREACFYRCGAVAGQAAQELPLAAAREKLVADMLVLQEQKKLGLGGVDNAAVRAATAETLPRIRRCASPCAAAVTENDVRDLVQRRMLVRAFLEQRVAVFIEVNEEEVRREIDQRSRAGASPEELAEGNVRRHLFEEKAAAAIRNWFARTTSKSGVVLAPLSEP